MPPNAAKCGKEESMHTCRTNYRIANAPKSCKACDFRELLYEALTVAGVLASLATLTVLADLLRG